MKKVLTSKLFQLVLLMGLAVALFSCEPVMCEECYTITDSNGSETICIEWDCTNNYPEPY